MASILLSKIVAKIKKENQYKDIFPELLREIHACLDRELYFAALSLALMLPDACGVAKYPNDSVAARYIKWYNEYIGQYDKSDDPYAADMPYLSGEVVYNLRNGLLHSANPAIDKQKSKNENNKLDKLNLVFGDTLGGDMKHIAYSKDYEVTYREYTLYVKPFCLKICDAAEKFYLENKEM